MSDVPQETDRSEAVQAAAKSLVYETLAPVTAIKQDVESLREMDKTQEQKQSRWGWIAFGGFIIGIIGFAMGLFGEWESPALFVSVMAIGAVVFVGGLIMRSIHARTNVEDRRYELLGQLLNLLGKDMASEATVNVRLDLSAPDAKTKFINKGNIGPWNVKFYEDGWLQLRGRFVDGTSYQLQVTELTQQRSRWKTNARGKSKYKSKTKSATTALLRLKSKSDKYPDLESIGGDARGAVQLPQWSQLKSLNVVDGALLMKAGTKTSWDVPRSGVTPPFNNGVQMLAMMFLSLYQILNLSRAIRKAQ